MVLFELGFSIFENNLYGNKNVFLSLTPLTVKLRQFAQHQDHADNNRLAPVVSCIASTRLLFMVFPIFFVIIKIYYSLRFSLSWTHIRYLLLQLQRRCLIIRNICQRCKHFHNLQNYCFYT